MKILHIGNTDKFIPPFIELVKENFDFSQHEFLLTSGGMAEEELREYPNVYISKRGKLGTLKYLLKSLVQMHKADKVILHGLFNIRFVQMLFFTPWLLKKCYWVMWGGDFYFPEKQSKIKHKVIKKIGYLVTGTNGDVELARKWYGAEGKHVKCFNYPSNLFKEVNFPEKSDKAINILVGNSATETNNHFKILNEIKKYKSENIKIYLPLSYGDKEYGKKVANKYIEIFGEKCIPIFDFMNFDAYMQFLTEIDIAIFDHERQQGFGNTVSLLGMGKKIYLNGVMEDYGLIVYQLSQFSLEPIDEKTKLNNIESIKTNFSKKSLVKSLKLWLE